MSNKETTAVAYEVNAKGEAVLNDNGLKTRRAEEIVQKVVQKPRKMKLLQPKRLAAKAQNFANPALLVFPTDRSGITSGIKKEFIKAASKLGTDKNATKLVNDTVEVLMKHMDARAKFNAESPALKARKDTSLPVETVDTPVEVKEAENAVETEVEYKDMLDACLLAGVDLKSRKKADVTEAYNTLPKEEA